MGVDSKLIDEINKLARKKKQVGLTKLEEKEQKKLREKYLGAFKENFKSILDNVDIVDKLEIESKDISDIEKKLNSIDGIVKIKEENCKIEITYDVRKIKKEEILRKIK